jgi:polysaccharide export outer membrane protein
MRSAIALAVSLIISTVPLRAEVVAALRAGDVFEMRLGGVPQDSAAEFGVSYTIDQGGTINVPLIGEVKAAGLRPAELERLIQTKLVAGQFFTKPTVLINVTPANRFMFLSGGVQRPQRLGWSPDATLSSAIGECGGLSDLGKGTGIRVIREGKVTGVYNLKEIQKDPSKDPKLLPGDQVIVRE